MELLDNTRAAMAEAFFDSFRSIVTINGYTGQYLAANTAFTAALGWTEEELRRFAYYDLVLPSERRSVIKLGATVVRHAGSEPRMYRRAFRHKDGSYRLVEWSVWADPKLSQVYAIGRVLGTVEPR